MTPHEFGRHLAAIEAAPVDRPLRIFRELHEARRWLDGFAPSDASAKG